MARFITVDPGLEGTGWAVWDTEVQMAPLFTGIWVAPRGKNKDGKSYTWTRRCAWLANRLSVLAAHAEILNCYVEYPIFFDDAQGHMGMKKGDIPKLIFLVGAMAYSVDLLGVEFVPVTVRDWKGQLSKKAVQIRVRKRLGEQACQTLKSHDWDAVGMGLWVQGALTQKPLSNSSGGTGRLVRVVRSARSRTNTSSKRS